MINYAHRGASEYAPENTLSSFYLGLMQGANGLETDVQKTRDGVLILFHDDTLDRVTDHTGKVSDYTWEELKKVKVSQIVGDDSQDGEKNSTLFSDTRVGSRGVQFRKYKYIGETKYVWKEFDCEQCGRHFTVTQMKSIEDAPQERKKELLAHFDASPKQENEPIREAKTQISKMVKLQWRNMVQKLN